MSLPCLPKSWRWRGDDIRCLLSKAIQDRDCSSHKAYCNCPSFRGPFVVGTLRREHNTNPCKLHSSSVSLQSRFPQFFSSSTSEASPLCILQSATNTRSYHCCSQHCARSHLTCFHHATKAHTFLVRHSNPHPFLSLSKVSHFFPHKTGTKSPCSCLKTPQGSPCSSCLWIQVPHRVILMGWKFISRYLVQQQPCCAFFSFWGTAQAAVRSSSNNGLYCSC